MRDAQRAVGGQQLIGRGQVGLGEAQQRGQPRVIGGDQEAVDEPGPGRWVGEGGDDDELAGVGDDDPLDGVGVVGGSPQHGGSRLHPDHPGQRAWSAGDVAGQRDRVTDHHPAAAQLARTHGGDLAAVDQDAVPAPLDGGQAYWG